MTGNTLAKVRSLFIRGMAVVAVILTYALSGVGTQIATTLGISALTLATTAQPAQAQWGWRRRYRRRAFFPRRRFYRRRWW